MKAAAVKFNRDKGNKETNKNLRQATYPTSRARSLQMYLTVDGIRTLR